MTSPYTWLATDGLKCIISQAEDVIAATKPDKEYLPITGLAEFNKNAIKLAYGAESTPLTQGTVRDVPTSTIRWHLKIIFRFRQHNPSLAPVLSVLVVNSWPVTILTPRSSTFPLLHGETTPRYSKILVLKSGGTDTSTRRL